MEKLRQWYIIQDHLCRIHNELLNTEDHHGRVRTAGFMAARVLLKTPITSDETMKDELLDQLYRQILYSEDDFMQYVFGRLHCFIKEQRTLKAIPMRWFETALSEFDKSRFPNASSIDGFVLTKGRSQRDAAAYARQILARRCRTNTRVIRLFLGISPMLDEQYQELKCVFEGQKRAHILESLAKIKVAADYNLPIYTLFITPIANDLAPIIEKEKTKRNEEIIYVY